MSAASRRPPRGRWIVIAGPDGAGKSTLTDALAGSCDRPPLRGHHRIGFLPSRNPSSQPVTQPHASTPYPTWMSYLKLATLTVDGLAGYAGRIRPALASGTWVLLERGWWDIEVDPLRYRVRVPPGVVLRLARLQPTPDLLVVLEAPVEVVLRRKAELDPEEIDRQMRSWRRIAASVPSLVLDSRRPIADLVADTRRAVGERDSRLAPGR